ncbi:hypothetical protein SBY92_003284 [Candida maltosa Xu316]
MCTNCSKNKEICTFDRTPLKRGPSKGYIRDLEEKVIDKSKEKSITKNNNGSSPTISVLPPSNSSQASLTNENPSSSIHSSLSHPPPQTLPFPQTSSSISNGSGGNTAIKLPPIINYSNTKTLPSPLISKFNQSTDPSNPSSPKSQASKIPGLLNIPSSSNGNASNNNTTAKNNENTNSPPIQGPFWKVPYEMPQTSSFSRKSSIGSITSGGPPLAHRRSSVESVSSISTNGSRLPSIKPTLSNDYPSDADSEDFYSVNSYRPGHRNSQSLSPRNSISSLSSLNGRINKSLNFQNPNSTSPMIGSPSIPQVHGPPPPTSLTPAPPFVNSYGAGIPLNTLEANLNIYYKHYHSAFPLLPYDSTTLISVLQDTKQPPLDWLVETFNHCLNNLVNFKQIGLQTSISLFLRLIQSYPFITNLSDGSLIIFLSSLMVLNYTILINGDQYNQGIAITASIFNDYKICDRFIEHVQKGQYQEGGNMDNIALYFTKLYYCLNLIDNLNSLSLGAHKNLGNPLIIEFLHNNTDKFVRNDDSLLVNAEVINKIALIKLNFMVTNNLVFEDIEFGSSNDQFLKYFYQLVVEKYQFIKFITHYTKNYQSNNDPQYETFNKDLLVKINHLVSTILNFANFISSHFHNSSTVLSISPILNLTLVQLFKLIKLNKLIIDKITTNGGEDLNKLNNDLSISFNLLNLNLPNLQIGNSVNLILKNKINHVYKFNFNNFSNTTGNLKKDWINEIFENIVPFIESDFKDGWM